MRAEADDELSVLIEARLRHGEDPWDFMEVLPSVDELVVMTIRHERLDLAGITHPSAAQNYEMLRQIALDHPPLVETVWRLLGRPPHRIWDSSSPAEAS
nr:MULTISPECIES: tryptophan synthase subunit alpha [Microbacterium]